MRSSFWVWLLPTLLCLGIMSLVATVRARSGQRSPIPRAVAVGASAFPLRIERAHARTQTLARRPERVFLANATVVDIASELISADRVVALPEQALTWSRLVDVDDGFRAKARFRSVDSEQVLAFAPDLILCSSFNQKFAGDWVEASGIPMVSLPHPRSIDELREIIRLLGTVLDAETSAGLLDDELGRRIDAIGRAGGARRGLGVLVYSNVGAGGYTPGRGTLADDMIRTLGMRNVAADLGKRDYEECTFEDIIVGAPDFIVVPGRYGEQELSTRDLLLDEPALAEVTAVARRQIVRLHPRLFSTGSHEIVEAAEQIAAFVDARIAEEARAK
ncbi:MAG: ABC transporter substrate-binding protein [Planctomycetes bacterium]|nr:ABC transporter substrate-binding protein [Planctomycetota bacterium]